VREISPLRIRCALLAEQCLQVLFGGLPQGGDAVNLPGYVGAGGIVELHLIVGFGVVTRLQIESKRRGRIGEDLGRKQDRYSIHDRVGRLIILA
jgi:hypothetical protein